MPSGASWPRPSSPPRTCHRSPTPPSTATPFGRSIVADVPVRLRVVAEVAAGWSTDRVVGPGEAIRIMTGAPLPAGADAVGDGRRHRALDGGEVLIHSGVGRRAHRCAASATTCTPAPGCSTPARSFVRRSPACSPVSTPDECASFARAACRRRVDRRRTDQRRLGPCARDRSARATRRCCCR